MWLTVKWHSLRNERDDVWRKSRQNDHGSKGFSVSVSTASRAPGCEIANSFGFDDVGTLKKNISHFEFSFALVDCSLVPGLALIPLQITTKLIMMKSDNVIQN